MKLFFTTMFASLVFSAAATEKRQLTVVLPETIVDTTTVQPGPLGHYGPPPNGCDKDETAFQISGIPGGVCAAKCTDFLPCPTDVPMGVSATPMCALSDQSTGSTYCVLICKSSGFLRAGDDQCGDATCQEIKGQNGLGICTYV